MTAETPSTSATADQPKGKRGRPKGVRSKPKAPPPEPFDVALWLDGSICIRGAKLTADGSVLLEREEALRLARHVLGLPQQPAAGEGAE